MEKVVLKCHVTSEMCHLIIFCMCNSVSEDVSLVCRLTCVG